MSYEQMETDLKRSGLSLDDAERLGFTVHETGYIIPYFGLDGELLPFSRTRLFETLGKQKYLQAAKTLPHPYLPPLLDWRAFLADPSKPLWITEGEKKAAKATLSGQPTIGLGGVWNWKSTKHNIDLLEELKIVSWEQRDVRIVFDRDVNYNGSVEGAAEALALKLSGLGAVCQIGDINAPEEGKMGLDDLIVAHPEDWGTLISFRPCKEDRLNTVSARFVYIEKGSHIYDLETDTFLSMTSFRQDIYANQRILNPRTKKQDTLANAWMEWKDRRTARDLVVDPTLPIMSVVDGKLNLWKGWGVAPIEGDVQPWFQLLDHLFRPEEHQYRKWFEQWLAYPIQHPGTKLSSSVVLVSHTQGVGKNLCAETIEAIYGEAARRPSNASIGSRFNINLLGALFVLVDEILTEDRRGLESILKVMITSEKMEFEGKFQNPIEAENRANYIFLTNRLDALLMSATDRRFFVHIVQRGKLDTEFAKKYVAWRENGGVGFLMKYLMDLDLTGFEPKGHAPFTEAKGDMSEMTASPLYQAVSDTVGNIPYYRVQPNAGWMADRELFSAEHLYYLGQFTTAVQPSAIAKVLRAQGYAAKRLVLPNGKKELVFALFNSETWRRRSIDEWLEAYCHNLVVTDQMLPLT